VNQAGFAGFAHGVEEDGAFELDSQGFDFFTKNIGGNEAFFAQLLGFAAKNGTSTGG
jgi:hypothetical protein